MKLKVLLLLLIATAFLNSCGLKFKRDNVKSESSRQFSTVDPAFQSYITKFEESGKTYLGDPNYKVINVPINFGDIDNKNHEGVCISYSNGESEIIIRKSWWDNASSALKESLLFHELGHCALGREHEDSTVEVNGTFHKVSMMNHEIVNSSSYYQYKEGYLKELFTYSTQILYQAVGVTTE